MNTEQLLNQVEEAIKNRPTSAAKRFWLCEIKGQFACVPMEPHLHEANVLATLNTKDIKDGLTTNQWARILTQIAKIKPKETT